MSIRLLTALALAAVCATAAAQPVTLFDFTQGDCGWSGNPRVAGFQATPEGISFRCVGEDPWIEGPAAGAMPLGQRLKLIIRMKSNADQVAELFYGPQFVGGRSVQFYVDNDGDWHDYEVLLPPQEKGSRLRIDPAVAESGEIMVAWIKAELFRPVGTVELIKPSVPEPAPVSERVGSDRFAVEHYGRHWNDFALVCDGKTIAWANPTERLGIVIDGKTRYVDLTSEPVELPMIINGRGHGFYSMELLQDQRGGNWTLTRTFEYLDNEDPEIHITTTVMVDRDTDVFHLPWLTLFPGLGSFGEHKTQAILPGVEYLADEPSSSEADLRGEQAIRRIVDDAKLTMTMMAVAADGQYISMMWDRADHPAPVFESPDQLFGSGAQVWGLWWPSVGEARLENSLEILKPVRLRRLQEYSMTVIQTGGPAESIVPAIQHYVAWRGLPPVPEIEGGKDAAMRLLAHGWTDSDAYVDGRWRHAVWGSNFPAQPAADALLHMRWLKDHLKSAPNPDKSLDARLAKAIERGREQLPASPTWLGGVGHVQRPIGPLVLGDLNAVARAITQMKDEARQNLSRFDEQGILHYRAAPDRPDYGSTHFADHANGQSAQALEQVLMAATFTGDSDLRTRGLALLDKQTALYANTVPRGAQTWEMPLHTPDILASGRLVRCYVLAWQLTGDEAYLDQARYWAWTGVSFIYLDAPVEGPVGPYATIAVLGATNWQAPNWIGLPVQWCGLVYGSALLDLARVDEQGSERWRQLANGVTAAGLQMTFPTDDAEQQGLLPDSWVLRPRIGQGPAINPGTVQAGLPELYDMGTMYELARLHGGLLAHAPGAISEIRQDGGEISFQVDGWPEGEYLVHLTGDKLPVEVKWENAAGTHDVEHRVDGACLTVQVSGKGRLILRLR